MLALRGILFDYSGTVLVSDEFDLESGLKEICSYFELRSNIDTKEVVRFAVELEHSLQEIRDQTVLEFSFDKFLRIVIDYFGIQTRKSLRELESIFYDAALSYEAAPGVRQFVETATAAGIRTGIISNSTHTVALLKRKINRSGLSDLFHFVMSSADYGIRKQHYLLYEIALSKLGLQRNDVVFIGDSLAYDVATAKAAGLTTVWYNRREIQATDGIEPDYEFKSWADVEFGDLKPVTRIEKR